MDLNEPVLDRGADINIKRRSSLKLIIYLRFKLLKIKDKGIFIQNTETQDKNGHKNTMCQKHNFTRTFSTRSSTIHLFVEGMARIEKLTKRLKIKEKFV